MKRRELHYVKAEQLNDAEHTLSGQERRFRRSLCQQFFVWESNAEPPRADACELIPVAVCPSYHVLCLLHSGGARNRTRESAEIAGRIQILKGRLDMLYGIGL